MTSTTGNIVVDTGGTIDGVGQGFESDKGPGNNSSILDNLGVTIPGYGATHAGLGFFNVEPGLKFLIFEDLAVTSEAFSERRVRLSARPLDPTAVALNVIHGGPQVYGTDFVVEDDLYISWLGSPLESLLVEGDALRAVYYGDTNPLLAPRPRYGHWETPVSL